MASKQEYERAFQAWAQDKPEYRDVLKELKAEYARIFDAYFALELMSETIRTGELNRIYNRPSFGDEIYPQVKALNRDLSACCTAKITTTARKSTWYRSSPPK